MGFLTGVRCGLVGVAACATTPALWPWALGPIAVAGLFFFLPAWVVGAAVTEWFRGHVTDWLGETAAGWITAGGALVLAAVVLIAAWFAFAPIARVLAAPFLALLSDRTVRRLAGREPPALPGGPFVRYVGRPVLDALVFLAIRLAVTVVTLPLLLLPVAGAFLFAAAQASLEGMDRMDVALSSRGVSREGRLRFVRRNFAAATGLGTVALLLVAVPVVGLFLFPGLAVGAVRLDRALTPTFPDEPA
ncbi:MAG: Sulfate transporter CysZ [Planctomycetes bacterium]|nr:Sulfate transporter CysZ [Planctomycetota bacterium]